MNRDEFIFMRLYIHFVNNKNQKTYGETGFDHLHKIKYILNKIMKNMRRAWEAGENITIDEIMIKLLEISEISDDNFI